MIRIYHNHRCSKSRSALALLEQHGEPFEIINYLDTPPEVAELKRLLVLLGIGVRQLLRSTEEEYGQLALDDLSLDEDTLIAAMAANPKLIERPIIVVNDKAVIGRPPEAVLSIL